MEIQIDKAPAVVGLRKKSLYYPSAETAAVKRAAWGARCTDRRLPVIFGNRIIAWVQGSSGSNRVKVWKTSGIDSLLNAFTVGGQQYSSHFSSLASTVTTALPRWYDMFPVGADAGVYTGTAFTARQFTDADLGATQHGGNVSPSVKVLTGGYFMDQNAFNIVLLYDRVLTYDACTFSGALSNMTNTLAAQRYIAAGQLGLCLMPTVQVAMGASSNLVSCTYLNQNGATNTVVNPTLCVGNTTSSTAAVNNPAELAFETAASSDFLFLPLTAGDSGVQSITSFQMDTATTGSFCWALVHPIAWLASPSAGAGAEYDFLREIAACERIYDGAFLEFIVGGNPVGNAACFQGALDFVWM